jgi:hypothetical protein
MTNGKPRRLDAKAQLSLGSHNGWQVHVKKHTSLSTLAKELLLNSLKQVQFAGCEVGHTVAVLKLHGTAASTPYDRIHARSQ